MGMEHGKEYFCVRWFAFYLHVLVVLGLNLWGCSYIFSAFVNCYQRDFIGEHSEDLLLFGINVILMMPYILCNAGYPHNYLKICIVVRV